ncbi:leukocyte elastase inhibitor [Dermacentor silvarum]|uniref:leukocyte elastase inhibitor n=1 Tax=Dermacentor silvarum TaxID=543639 RepID=UPI00189B5D01|nr:leukocyte elastase inhibitor [Dermacentor silvarum]
MPKSLSRMVVRFSVDLHKELLHSRKDKKENVTSSPFMITAALSMTFAGARENTADELLAVLRGKDEKLHENFASFMPKLSSHSHKLQFHVANRIYSDEKFPVVEEYATFVNSTYASTIQSVDFEKRSEAVRGQINDWVKVVTESKIVDLLAPGSVNPTTNVLLINAVYFKGLWESPFPASSTSRRDFNVDSKTKVQVDMMCQKQEFAISHSEELGVRAIEMPYRGGRTSMIILLPDEIEGLSHLEHHLSHCKLSNIVADLKETPNVEVIMPKLLLHQCLYLKDTLVAMGVNDLFSGKCDLSGMFKTGNPVVSEMIHSVYLQIDEDGTDAAVATPAVAAASTTTVSPAATQKTEFVVDHPFMLLVLKSKSDVILFMSSVRHP